MENVRQELQDFARVCESLLSTWDDKPPMNIAELSVVCYYASSMMDRCKALIAGKNEQRPQ